MKGVTLGNTKCGVVKIPKPNNPRLRRCVHSSPPLLLILSQMNPVHALPRYTFNILFNIIVSSKRTCSEWPPSFKSSQQHPVCDSPLTLTCHMPYPSHLSLFDHLNKIWWAAQIMKLLIMQSSPVSCCRSLLDMIRYEMIWCDIYLLQLGFRQVAVVGRLVQK